MEDQHEFIIRRSGGEEVGSEANNKAALEDIGHNADMYIANQEGNTQARSFGYCLTGEFCRMLK